MSVRDPNLDAAPDDASGGRDAVEALVELYFERRRSGASTDAAADLDELARRVPGREEEFRQVVETLNALESAAAPKATRSQPALEARERLGRFRLLRLIGRGGMGAVYEAADEELDRRVALKILPGHAALEAREIERFHREAQAAARLRHPHIVPVFGVGEDDGTHWLTMQLVAGESLEQLLQRARASAAKPLPAREVARHGLAIAEALASAHAEGVLHRDVKPSNLLLDASGVVFITDFGLAKAAGNATLTRTGEAVGTPRYMAPEAFSGWADPRTDVWGLGATLYELLAGRPAFGGEDRAQLLKQIHSVEPTPLRRLDPSVPRDLATIVHKCLQKEPAARYATARELADDLGRFLASQPIHARPPSLAYRVGLLGRRHPIATLLLFLALMLGFVMTARETRRARGAEARERRRFDDVRKLAGSFLFEFHDAIRNLPGSTAARALVVQRGLEYLDRLSAEGSDDPGLRRELAAAYQRVGDVQGNPYQPNLGDTAGALRSYRRAIDLLDAAVDAGAAGAATSEDEAILASACLVSGGIECATGDPKAALANTERGLELRKRLAAREPTPARRLDLATAWQYAAFHFIVVNQGEDATHALEEQAAILRDLMAAAPGDLAVRRSWGQHRYLSGTRTWRTDPAAAAKCYEDAIAVQQELLAGDPGNTSLQRDLAWSLVDQGRLLDFVGKPHEALANYRRVLTTYRALEDADAASRDARTLGALAQNNVGSILVEIGEPEAALEALEDAVARCEALLAADPSNAFVQWILAMACANTGWADFKIGDPASLDAACGFYERAIAIYEQSAVRGGLPTDQRQQIANWRKDLAECEKKLGIAPDR